MSSKNLTVVKDMEFAKRFAVACGTDEPAEIERKYGIAYHTAKNYLEGRLPTADILKRIKSLTNVHIDWLLTGEGEKFVNQKNEASFDEIFEEKIAKIVHREILRGAVTLQSDDVKSSESNYSVLNDDFSKTYEEILTEVAERIELAVEASKRIGKGEPIIQGFMQNALTDLKNGKINKEFRVALYEFARKTNHRLEWLLEGTGDENISKEEIEQPRKSSSLRSPDELSMTRFFQILDEAKKASIIVEKKQQKMKEKEEMRRLVYEILEDVGFKMSNAQNRGEVDAAEFANPIPMIKASDV